MFRFYILFLFIAHNVVAGPPTDLSVVNQYRDIYNNTLSVTIQWKPPHDISAKSTVDSYMISTNGSLVGKSRIGSVLVPVSIVLVGNVITKTFSNSSITR